MEASQKPDMHLVERTGQRPSPEEKPKEISAGPHAEDQYRTASERRAEGKALREDVPREAHGGWKPHKDRRNPLISARVQRGQIARTCADSAWTDGVIAVRFFPRFRRAHGRRPVTHAALGDHRAGVR